MSLTLAQPPTLRAASGHEADTVFTSIGCAESEFAGVRAFGIDDTVVVVEDFVDGHGDGKVRIRGKDIVLGLEGAVVAYGSIDKSEKIQNSAREVELTDDQGVLWELFVEAFWICRGGVQVEVEGLRW